MQRKSISLTEGPVWKGILLFTLPLLTANLFQQFYNAFDSWVVGKFLGETALAAVSSAGNLIYMMIGFFNGVAMGAGVVIAKFFGARDYPAMNRAIHTDIAFGLASGVFLTVFGVLFTPTILVWMQTPAEVMHESVVYFRWYSWGIGFAVMYNIFVGILHAVGDSKHPLYYLIFSTFVNVILDLLFVAVLGFGVGAAAIATTVSQGISALLCFLHLIRGKDLPYRLNWRKIGFHGETLADIIRFGLPSGVQNSVIGLANVVVQSNINAFGAAAMAGCGANAKIEGFALLPILCFAQALTTFVSQNLGAHRHDRVKKGVTFGIACSMLMAQAIGILCYLFAPALIRIFNSDSAVVTYGTGHMRIICLFYSLPALSHAVAGILRGAGKASVPMVTMLACWCLIRVAYISVAVVRWPVLATVSWAYPITWVCSSVAFLIYLRRADWIHNFDRLEGRDGSI